MTRPRKRRAYIRKIVRAGHNFCNILNKYYKEVRGGKCIPITDIYYRATAHYTMWRPKDRRVPFPGDEP